MITVTCQSNAQAFLEKCGDYLYAHPAEHNLSITLCERAAKDPSMDILCMSIFDEDKCMLTAIQTPPHNLILNRGSIDHINLFIDTLITQQAKLPGVLGPVDMVNAFIEKWTKRTAQKTVTHVDQLIYSITEVTIPKKIEGSCRLATEEDVPIIAQFYIDFYKEALPESEWISAEKAPKKALKSIQTRDIGLWIVNDLPVSLSATGYTEKSARIGPVYTPPKYRGNGYASALVAEMSQRALDKGKKDCCLYTNAANPISNKIYQNVGYKEVSTSIYYVLENA